MSVCNLSQTPYGTLGSNLEQIMKLDDLLDKPEAAYVGMDEKNYRAEQDLADRYRSFVAEILRLSLAGLAVFSFIYKQNSPLPETLHNPATKDVFAFWGLAMFALSAFFALVFLYCASEALRWYIVGLRYRTHLPKAQPAEGQAASGKTRPEDACLAKRKRWIKVCRASKALAASTLALGGIFMACAIILLKY